MSTEIKKRVAWNKGLKGFQAAWNKGIKGIMKPNKTSFKKGIVPWNKGKNGVMPTPWNKNKKTGIVPKTAFKKGLHVSRSTEFKRGQTSKERNINWKGGITPENVKIRTSIESKLWRDSVFARDGYVCQKTGVRGCDLVAHHILNFAKFPELRFAIDNGITLSEKAHKEFHKKYGNRHNTMEQINEFLGIVGQNC